MPPEDPTQEDKKVLALFDTLLEEDKEDDGGFLSMLLRPHGIEILTDSTDTDLDSMLELANVLSDSSALTSSEEEEEDSEEEEDDDDDDEDLVDVYGSDAGDWYSSRDEFEDTSFDLTNESSLDTSTESSDSSSSSEGGTGGEGSEGLSQEQREGAVNGMRNRERESGVVSTESAGGTEGGGEKEEGGEVEGVGGGMEGRGSVGGTVDGDTLASRGISNGVPKGEREEGEGSEDRNENSKSNCNNNKDIADGTMKLTEEAGPASRAKGATSAVVRDAKKEGEEETDGGSMGHSNNEGVNRKRGRSSGDLVTNGATSTSSSDSSETDHMSSTDRHCPRLNRDDLCPLSTEDQNGVSTRNGSVLKGPAQKDTSASENSVSEMSRDRLACSTEDASPLPKAKSKRQKLMERRANEGDYSQYKREDFLKGKGL